MAGNSTGRTAKVARVLLAVIAATGFAGIGRLAIPGAAVAIDCNFVLHPLAVDDPTTQGVGPYTVLEDGFLTVGSTVGVLVNDGCTAGAVITPEDTPDHGNGGPDDDDGGFEYVPDDNWFGTDGVNYRFSTPTLGYSNYAHISLYVTPVNDKPALDLYPSPTCPPITVAEDSGAYTHPQCQGLMDGGGGELECGQVFTGHATSDNPGLFSSVSLVIMNVGTCGANSRPRIVPAANASGSATVTWWVTDSGGTANGGVNVSDKFTVSVTVTAVDDAPNAVNDSYSTAFGHTLVVAAGSGLLHNDTDVDGPSLSATKVSGPAHGSATVASDGSFSYTPTSGYAGSDSFTYRTTAGSLSDTATVAIQVLAANATVPPPTKAPASTPVPSAGAIPTAGPSAVALASPTASTGATTEASGSPSPDASAGPSEGASAGAPSPAASSGPGPVSPSSGSDLGPWLIILLIIVILVVGGNLALYQVRRSRQPPAT